MIFFYHLNLLYSINRHIIGGSSILPIQKIITIYIHIGYTLPIVADGTIVIYLNARKSGDQIRNYPIVFILECADIIF
ncbi:hypothetical protein [Pedobacter africanus]|uniref:Membrane protein n=1 Tax=Pedobacter africanus TaxID=151894 RepID=A0ACC6KSW5_9SPHI|nr:hypothetical protein [Pedobacter africanus]MDR6782316.1 putative membrane protein [Pedobacter africanus]